MSESFGPSDPPVRRGRRDPRLAQEIAVGTSAGARDGEVVRRPAGPEEMDMVPLGDDHLNDGGEQSIDDGLLLLPGDIVALKVTHEIEGQYGRSWVAYGVQTRVMEGESEEDAFIRVASQVNVRVLDAAADADEKVTEFIAAQQEAERHRPIRPQQ